MCFFFRKKTDKFFCDWIAQAENFLPLNCYFLSLSQKTTSLLEKKSGSKATTIHSFFYSFSTLLLIKNIVLRRKMSFFFECIHLQRKKITVSIKMGSNFFCHPTLHTKKHISDKNFLLLFPPLFLSPSFFFYSSFWMYIYDNRRCQA